MNTVVGGATVKENDEQIGYGEVDKKKYELIETINALMQSEIVISGEKVVQEATPEEQEETDQIYQYFLKLAGEDQEVDWMELKEILDHAMKAELGQQEDIKASSKRKVNAVHAAPSSTIPDQPPQTEVTSVLSNIFGVLCGVLCKDTPLAEIIPAPTQTAPLNTSFVEVGLEGFSKDICRSMVAMLDADRSGRLGYHEFKKLWIAIRTWKNAWLMYDIDRSGTFSGFELREALNSAGYRLNTHVLNILMHRFGNKRGEIHFDDFMMCAIKLKTMIDLFMEKDKLGTDSATFSMEEWLECTLYS